MYRCITILLISLLCQGFGHAKESRATLLLKPLQVMCEDIATLELTYSWLDPRKPLNEMDISRLSDGKSCSPSFKFQRVAEVNRTEHKGRKIVCYRLWDATRPTAPNHGQVWCSVAEALQTIDQVVASRVGDYEMETHNISRDSASSEIAIAACAEGGRIFINRAHGVWVRNSALNIDSPHKYPPMPIPKTSGLDNIIRNGCRGVDYE